MEFGHCGSFTAKFVRPGDFGIGADKAEAAHAGLHLAMVFVEDLGIGLELDPEHQLLPLLGRLDALWRELGLGRDEADRRGEHILRDRDRGSCVPRRPA